MNNFHIIIQQERRTPVVKERRVYLGEYGYKEDADGCTYMVELEPDNFEIVVEEDRSRMAQSIIDQLHTHNDKIVWVDGVMHVWRKIAGEDVLVPWLFQDDPQIIMVAEWNGNPNYVIQHKGDYAARTRGYAGWPEITKEQFDALAVDTPAA